MISIIVTLVIIGLLLYIVGLIPMDETIKLIVRIIVLLAVCLWLLQVFGVYDFPIYRHR